MKITEMITQLEALKAEHGDLPVYADEDADEIEIARYGFHALLVGYIYIRAIWSPEGRTN